MSHAGTTTEKYPECVLTACKRLLAYL